MTHATDTIDDQAARERAERWMAPARRGEPARHMYGRYTCTRCGVTYDTYEDLADHRGSCPGAANPPTTTPGDERHMDADTPQDAYPCRYCERAFKTPGGRGRHEKRFHYDDWKDAKMDAIPDQERAATEPEPDLAAAEPPDDAIRLGPVGAVLAELQRGQQILKAQLAALRSAELALTHRAEEG